MSPAFQTYGHTQAVRRPLPTSDATALATQAYTPDAADHAGESDAHHVQFVSAALPTGTIFAVGNRIALAVQGQEAHEQNQLFLQVWVGVYSNDGSTLRQTLRAKTRSQPELSSTAASSRFLVTTVANGYTTVAGDRLVVELSVVGSPTIPSPGVQGHNASLRWGADGTSGDLPEGFVEASTYNPWFEIADGLPEHRGKMIGRFRRGTLLGG